MNINATFTENVNICIQVAHIQMSNVSFFPSKLIMFLLYVTIFGLFSSSKNAFFCDALKTVSMCYPLKFLSVMMATSVCVVCAYAEIIVMLGRSHLVWPVWPSTQPGNI